jgi:phage-related protein
MADRPSKIPVRFHQTATGREPVRAWLRDLDSKDRRIIGGDILTVQHAWPVGPPLCKSLGHDLWEIRSSISSSRIARVIFSFYEGQIVLLNGFVKKAQKTPTAEITLARARLKEITR